MNAPTVEQTTEALATAEGHNAARLKPALAAAENYVRAHTPTIQAEAAVRDLRQALVTAGAAALGGEDPQQLEDALYAATPESPLAEWVFRQAWLKLVDDLSRSGDKPPFGGTGGAEGWAFSACSRAWPFVDGGQVAEAAAHFDAGQKVVVVRGAGRSSFLAALRRQLLSAHGVDAFVPPVTPAARDDISVVLKDMVARAELPEGLKKALPQLNLGEDLLGVFGRAGEKTPVALLLDDAHLQSRACLMGLPLFVEPSEHRRSLLVLSAPAEAMYDGPLVELIEDARVRDMLVEINLASWGAPLAADLLATRFDADATAWADALVEAVGDVKGADALRVAHAWLDALSDDSGRPVHDAEAQLKAGFDASALLPNHPEAVRILAIAALEGGRFHGLSVGKVLGKDEDFVEDLLHDDEFELDGALVGTCDDVVVAGSEIWVDLHDGLHPVFAFSDARVVAYLQTQLKPEDRKAHARTLRDTLLNAYQPHRAWQIADRLWRLDLEGGRDRQVQQLLLGTNNPGRVEAGFRRMLPVLGAKAPYRLALARLYGAAMEVGGLASATGKVQLADQGFQAAAAAAQRLERPGAAGEALARLGEIRLALALPEPAMQALKIAAELLGQAGHVQSVARVALLQAEVKLLEGNLSEGIASLKATIDSLRTSKDQGHVALGLVRLGRVLYEQGEVESGIMALDEAVRGADAAGDPRPAAAARMARAFVYAEQNQLEPAFKLLQEAAQAFQASRMPAHVVEIAAADLQRRHGHPVEAEARLRKVGEAFKKAGAAVQWADAWHGVGRCLIDQAKTESAKATEATSVLEEALDIRRRARDRFALLRLYEDLAKAADLQGNPAQAVGQLSKARRIAERLGLAGHLGRFDAAMQPLVLELDKNPHVEAKTIQTQAAAEIDELEAVWKAGPQPIAKTDEATVH